MKCACPNYYTVGVWIDGKVELIECSDLIEALIIKNGFKGYDAFLYGNIIKYVFRAGSKENTLHDLMKARDYIEQLMLEVGRLDSDNKTD